jgi:FMN phosphatase YigB (HAD superfamily)
VARVADASKTITPPPAPTQLELIAPDHKVTLRIGIMAHVYYADLLDEFAGYLSHMPVPFDLLVSVISEDVRAQAEERFSGLKNVRCLDIRVVPNRGRDLAPFFATFADEIARLDLIAHIHTKKSLYTGSEQNDWRRYLLDTLLGGQARLEWLLGTFQSNPRIGLIYPESHPSVPLAGHTWLSNLDSARELGRALELAITPDAYLDFPAGSMFWARVEAIRPLLELGLQVEDFPPEAGQKDGTLQHALERMIGQIVRHRDFAIGVLPTDQSLTLSSEGDRNWSTYFGIPISEQIMLRAIGADIVSFDIFDTLVTRPFLSAGAAQEYLNEKLESQYLVTGIGNARTEAETRARLALRRDPMLEEVHRYLVQTPGFASVHPGVLTEAELERRWLRPRLGVLAGLERVARTRRIIAVSDMYHSTESLRLLLPRPVSEKLEEIHVSCQTALRKEDGSAWERLPGIEGIPASRWLHVGDNEHADIQRPFDAGYVPPVHVLRPAALLDVVPALRPLRLPQANQGWREQLWRGLLGNRLAAIADDEPSSFGASFTVPTARDFGYLVIGPLVLEYLGWLGRLALERRETDIGFLSREGFLLKKAFHAFQRWVPRLATIEGRYLQVSRRTLATATVAEEGDLATVLAGTFSGTLNDLVRSRLGSPAHAAVAKALNPAVLDQYVFLPDMQAETLALLAPSMHALLEVARGERSAYLLYWEQTVGKRDLVIADLGYAGTIQSGLSRLTGRPYLGAYFALDARARDTELHGGEMRARFYDGRNGDGCTSPILSSDLLLEAALSAPEGQLSHMEIEQGRPTARRNEDTRSTAAIQAMNQIQGGIIELINDAGIAVGEELFNLRLEVSGVQQPLASLQRGLWRPGEWVRDLAIDDDHTGRGLINFAPTIASI